MIAIKTPLTIDNIMPIFLNYWNIPAAIAALFVWFADELLGLPPYAGLPLIVVSIIISWYWQYKSKQIEHRRKEIDLERAKIRLERYRKGEIQEDNINNEPG